MNNELTPMEIQKETLFHSVPAMRQNKFSLKPFLDWLPLDGINVLEIGCFGGDGTIAFLQSDKVRSITCIDPFTPGYDKGDKASYCDMPTVFQKWAWQVSTKNPGGKPVTLFANQTVNDIQHSLPNIGLCYIDGSHVEKCVFDDLDFCLSLMPQVIAGHDYGVDAHPGVKSAVDIRFSGQEVLTFRDSSWAVILAV